MLSAAKTKDINEVKKFIGWNDFYCSYKLDGLTLVVRYKNGQFVQAVTRGTGFIGEDVTEQAKMISNLPMTIPYYEDLELRGECVVSWDNFKKINENLENKYSHPRNLAAGGLRNLDTNVTRDRHLEYIVFECVKGINDDNKLVQLEALLDMGFDVVICCSANVERCIHNMKPEDYDYPVDGLIFEMLSHVASNATQTTAHHEGCRMALKWADNTYETTLLGVEWNPTRTGLIAPTAVFSEIDLDGALTTRATLHNLSIIKQLELGIGDTITVYRSNMVIPKIDDNLTRSNTLEIPQTCPCCGSETVIKNTDNSQVLMCMNPDCAAKKIAQFTHFVSRKCINIDGLSEATLEKLISLGYINSFKDIYGLSNYRDQLIDLDGLGAKSVEKLLLAIEKSRNVKLENFIAALGIPNIGLSAAKTISQKFNGNFHDWMDAYSHGFPWDTLDDFGETMADNLDVYLEYNYSDLLRLADEMNFIVPETKSISDNPFNGKSLCVTGKLSHFTRDSINEKIISLGAKSVGSVSKKTDYLITNEASGSSKYKKAVELNVPIITEDEFLKMCSET
jgi:DNA ligase (NAD+)